MDLKNKKVLVVGLAKSGIPTVKVLSKLGARITVNDIKSEVQLKDILLEIRNLFDDIILGYHPSRLEDYDLIVLSPGVPTDLDFIKEAKKNNILLIGELELAYRLSNGVYIGITGTNGKTTTTALTGEIFKNSSYKSFTVGNIGIAAISKALETDDNTVLVTEVSSFQLETIDTFRPRVSAILNISPDHLNRHKTMENYISAKSNIFKNQRNNDILVLNYDNHLTRSLSNDAKCKVFFFSRLEKLDEGIYLEGKNIVVSANRNKEIICTVDDISIPGKHNLENALAASAIAYNFGIDKLIIRDTLRAFKGVAHRLEFVEDINGVKFINDSKGTNPDASIKAIEAINPPIILIAGGMDKGGSFDEFIESFDGKVKKLILIGETAEVIKNTAIKHGFNNISIHKNMEEAVKESFITAKPGSSVLLSPACASWDMYDSFEHRGEHFKECVHKLRG